MSTRGFVGFKKGNEIKGWYNHSSSYYSYLGEKILDKYEDYSHDTISDFFLKNITLVKNDKEDRYYQNHKDIFDKDWFVDKVTLQDGSGFLWDGLSCEYGYVFNLDNDTVEVYRSYFTLPQERVNEGKRFYESFDGTKYYTHHVCTITRENTEQIRKMFRDEDDLNENAEQNDHWEEKFLVK